MRDLDPWKLKKKKKFIKCDSYIRKFQLHGACKRIWKLFNDVITVNNEHAKKGGHEAMCRKCVPRNKWINLGSWHPSDQYQIQDAPLTSFCEKRNNYGNPYPKIQPAVKPVVNIIN